MRARLLIASLFLSGCTSVTSVRGPYGAILSTSDIQQIRRLAQESPHFGHTVFTLDAVQRDEVHVRTREHIEDGSDGQDLFVTRRDGRWLVDERHPRHYTPERIVVVH